MQVLHVEDSSADSEIINHMIERAWPDCAITTVTTRADFSRAIEKAGFDLIISDYTLPGFSGLEALSLAHQLQPDAPFIFCSGTIGEDRAIEAIRAGATDYVLKDNLNRLGPAIRRALQEAVEKKMRRETESRLFRSERRYRALVRATAEIVWSADANGENISAEPPWHEFTGVSESHIQNGGWIETIHPSDRDAVAGSWTNAMKSRSLYEAEFRVRRADGVWRNMLARGVPQYRSDGQVEEWVGVCFDITARREAEEGERRLVGLLESATDFVLIADPKGEILYSNPAAMRTLGLFPSRPEARHFLRDYFGATSRERLASEYLASAEAHGEWSGEAELEVFNGRRIPISLVLVSHRSSDGRISHFSSIMRDISVAKEAQRTLREQSEVIFQASEAVIITDLENRVSFWNRGAEQIFGWSAAEVIGRTGDELFDPALRDRLSAIRAKANDAGSWNGEVELHRRDKATIHVDLRTSLIRDELGTPKARLAIISDITDRKNLEEQFLRAQRLENLGLLASGISHDLNNILTPILMAAPLLHSRLSDDGDRKLIETLEQSAQRGAEMVQQILSFARGTGGDFRLVQVRHLLRDIVRIAESTFPKSIVVSHLIAPDLLPVQANPTQIHQLLLNLSVNARDAMPLGGKLSFKADNITARFPIGIINGGQIPPGRYVALDVSDTGTGIAPDVLARMWEPFFTTKGGQGTGLGLSTVRGIVGDHGGFIDVETAPNRGTTFRVYLPAQTEMEIAGGSASPFARSAGEAERILILDDESSLREMVGTTLASCGYHPIVVASAAEAIEMVRKNPGSIHVLITDVSMPDMGGAALARAIRKIAPGIKILVMSGHADAERFGDDFIPKPFKPDRLLQCLEHLLRPAK